MKNKAYLLRNHKVTRLVYENLERHLSRMNEHERHLIKHVACCNIRLMLEHQEDIRCPVPSTLIRRKVRHASIPEIVSAGHFDLGSTKFSRLQGKCRRCRASDDILKLLAGLPAICSAEEYMSTPKVNLFNGRLCNQIERSKLTLEPSRRPAPSLIVEAVRTIERNMCSFNLPAVEQHLERKKEVVNRAKRDFGASSETAKREWRRFLVDYYCWTRGVLDQQPDQIDRAVWAYMPPYRVNTTGRIYHAHGGLQCCSHEMKRAAYSNIPGVLNYDISASHLNGLLREAQEAGTPSDWILDYVTNYERRREEYARRLGISTGALKKAIFALVYGSKPGNRQGSIFEVLSSEVQYDEARILDLVDAFRRETELLTKELKAWQDWVLKEYPKNGERRKITNKCGMTLDLDQLEPAQKRAKITAFLLQGSEACFIHHLTVLGDQYGYQVMTNEHDGIVVRNEVPQEAITEAKRLSGLGCYDLVLKEL